MNGMFSCFPLWDTLRSFKVSSKFPNLALKGGTHSGNPFAWNE